MQVEDRAKVNARIVGAFKAAADVTGASFDQLARTAARESDNRPDLASKTSSAKGLFQFVDQTWFEMIKKEGPSVGLERLAGEITSDGKGGLTVADPKEKARILALKTDPLVASVMAGKFTEANGRAMTESLGRAPTEGELYAAHVLGASGATKLVRMSQAEPTATASLAFPKAAAANPGLFYGKDGKPRTAAELLGRLTGADAGTRVAEAHAALPADTRKLDPTALAAVIRAQAAAKVSSEGLGAGDLDRLTAARFARAALSEKSMPGASADVVPPIGARIDGWRAKAPADAFSALMRSDGESLTADAAIAAGNPAAAPIRFASADGTLFGRQAVGGAAGGIPYVDPTQPMRLLADPAHPVATGPVGQPVGARPSRLMSRATSGAPGMPLPMLEGGRAVPTTRISPPTHVGATDKSTHVGATDKSTHVGATGKATLVGAGAEETTPSGLVAPGAARVKTVSIAPAPRGEASSGRPLLPPVPGEGAMTGDGPTVPVVSPARATSNRNRPLDLLGLQRRAAAGR